MILPARREKAVAHSSGSTARVGPSGHYRCVGIGVGPANLSLASLLYSYPDMSNLFLEQQAARRATRDAADRAQAAAQRARGPGPRDANDVWVRMPPVPLEYQGRELARRFFSTIAFRQGRPPGGQQILRTPRVHLQRRGRPTSGRSSRRRQVLAPLAGSTGAAAPCAPRAGQISAPAQKGEQHHDR
jgi:hypothetical protein